MPSLIQCGFPLFKKNMSLLTFLFEAVFISLSGVIAPGPITAVTLGKGNNSPHAGAFVAIGHGVIEFPLMISIFYGLGYLLQLSYVKATIALVGGLFLLFMAIGMFRSITQREISSRRYPYSPIIAGVLLSIGNPYFLVWWATIGAALILHSFKFGVLGFTIFYVSSLVVRLCMVIFSLRTLIQGQTVLWKRISED